MVINWEDLPGQLSEDFKDAKLVIQHRKRRAVYAGSFDPLTFGHLWVIRYGCDLFDELIVAIGENPEKKYTFSLADRLAMLNEVVEIITEENRGGYGYDNRNPQIVTKTPNCKVRVDSFQNQFLINYAMSVDARFILRGLRNEQDYAAEKSMAFFNADQNFGNPMIQTVFAPCPKHLTEFSSSMVKGLCGPEGWQHKVMGMVPDAVFKRILAWKGCPDWTPEKSDW